MRMANAVSLSPSSLDPVAVIVTVYRPYVHTASFAARRRGCHAVPPWDVAFEPVVPVTKLFHGHNTQYRYERHRSRYRDGCRRRCHQSDRRVGAIPGLEKVAGRVTTFRVGTGRCAQNLCRGYRADRRRVRSVRNGYLDCMNVATRRMVATGNSAWCPERHLTNNGSRRASMAMAADAGYR